MDGASNQKRFFKSERGEFRGFKIPKMVDRTPLPPPIVFGGFKSQTSEIPGRNLLVNLKQPTEQFKITPKYVLFGTYKCQVKEFVILNSEIKFISVPPNNKNMNYKFHVTIPFSEVKELKICSQMPSPTVFICPIELSVQKIQEAMNIGKLSDNARFDPTADFGGERWIIVVLPHWDSRIEQYLKGGYLNHVTVVDSRHANYLISLAEQPKFCPAEKKEVIVDSKDTKSYLLSLSRAPVCSNNLAKNAVRPEIVRSPYSMLSRRQPIRVMKSVTSVILIDDDGDSDSGFPNEDESKSKQTDNLAILTYPPDNENIRIDKISLYENDLTCLEKDEFLNDNIVCFYLKYILNELTPSEIASRTIIFDSFFYTRLQDYKLDRLNPSNFGSTTDQKIHNRVKQFTKNLDICSKDFIIIPVCKDHHWWVAIICYAHRVQEDGVFTIDDEKTNSCIIYMDSMFHSRGSYRGPSLNFRRFLKIEFKQKRQVDKLFDIKLNFRDLFPEVPSQTNGSDCGLYVLEYVSRFLKDPEKIIDQTIKGSDSLKNWFDPEEIAVYKRNEIRQTVFERVPVEIRERLEKKFGYDFASEESSEIASSKSSNQCPHQGEPVEPEEMIIDSVDEKEEIITATSESPSDDIGIAIESSNEIEL